MSKDKNSWINKLFVINIFKFLKLNIIFLVFSSGMIVNTPAYNEILSYETYKLMIDSLQADIVVVLD